MRYDRDDEHGLPVDEEGRYLPCPLCGRVYCDHLPEERPDSKGNQEHKLKIDEFAFKLLNKKHIDEIRFVMAEYAMSCLHDTELAKEAMKICEKHNTLKGD